MTAPLRFQIRQRSQSAVTICKFDVFAAWEISCEAPATGRETGRNFNKDVKVGSVVFFQKNLSKWLLRLGVA